MLANLVDALDLDNWAKRRDAQGRLPQVVRRLIRATTADVRRISFPAGDGIQMSGWDGLLEVGQGSPHVPASVSGWEVSTAQKITAKANADYETRCREPEGVDPAATAFVFVTLRRWRGRRDWAAARQEQGIWREVRAIDANDLQEWLELAPAVHVWLSGLVGKKRSEGVDDLENCLADWSAATSPPLSLDFVLAGRPRIVEHVRVWLCNPAGPLSLSAESPREALAVFAAVVMRLPEEERVRHLARIVVVRDFDAWLQVADSTEPLILVRMFEEPDAAPRAIRLGHGVVLPLGRDATPGVHVVPPVSVKEAADALVGAGLSEDRARKLARVARSSMTSFRRTLALSPNMKKPEWAGGAEAKRGLPAMLAGAWSGAQGGDKEVIAFLADAPYEELEAHLLRWSNETDPCARRVGDSWFVVSREDAWSLLSPYLRRQDLERFEEAALRVLGEHDPRFDLAEGRRWLAGVLGKGHPYSGHLREGIAEMLAILGARGGSAPISDGITAADYAARVVGRLLDPAKTDWRIWASMSRSLPLLAEAAPGTFLEAVEQGLSGDASPMLGLFAERDHVFASFPYSGLLWALETLAWSPELLARASLLMAKLVRVDEGGGTRSGPLDALREIFILWNPQTMASSEARFRALDVLRAREPDVAWRLMSKLLPEVPSTATPTQKPRWREWASDGPANVTPREHRAAIGLLVTRMLADVGVDGTRWQTLIGSLDQLPPAEYAAVLEQLAALRPEEVADEARASIRDGLRQVVGRHRSCPDAEWAIPADRLDILVGLHDRFEPRALVTKHCWLFGIGSLVMLEGRGERWDEWLESTSEARRAAATEMYSSSRLQGLLQLARRVQQSGQLGVTVGEMDLIDVDDEQVVLTHLESSEQSMVVFAQGFAAGRVQSRGRDWAEMVLAGRSALSADARARILLTMPREARTWDLVDTETPDAFRLYWRMVDAAAIVDDVERMARGLLANGRPRAAVGLLELNLKSPRKLSGELISRALEQALRTRPDEDPVWNDFAYVASMLLDYLEAEEGADEKQIARLEFLYLPIVSRRPPKRLHQQLSASPEFFAEIISMVFRAEGEEAREVSSRDEALARHGYELLQSWRTVPGTTIDGSLDGGFLSAWIQTARELTAAAGRRAIGEELIGQLLSGAPKDADGAWPHVSVREILEVVASADLERGLEIGLANSRGATMRDPIEGGKQERELEHGYIGHARVLAQGFPRTAALLRRMAERYQADALREDQRAEIIHSFGA